LGEPATVIGVTRPSFAATSMTGSSMMTTDIFGASLSAVIFCRFVSEFVPS
jgi:hypothetical protein